MRGRNGWSAVAMPRLVAETRRDHRLRRLGIATRAVPEAVLNRSAIYIGPRTLYGMSAPSPGSTAM